jgi:hypothetical protein
VSLFETMEPYAWHGSWAVWGSWDATPPFDRHGNLRFPMHETQHLNKLHGRAVIIGLNPAGDGQPPLRIPGHEWTNFHWPGKHNDHFLATAFYGTWLWGCYMTDLVPGTHQSKSAEVNPGDMDVEAFMQEVSLLGDAGRGERVGVGRVGGAKAGRRSQLHPLPGQDRNQIGDGHVNPLPHRIAYAVALRDHHADNGIVVASLKPGLGRPFRQAQSRAVLTFDDHSLSCNRTPLMSPRSFDPLRVRRSMRSSSSA